MNREREAGREGYNKSNSSSLGIGKFLWMKLLLSLDQKDVFEGKSKHLGVGR